jgi:hypothetical protein
MEALIRVIISSLVSVVTTLSIDMELTPDHGR